MKEIVRKLAKGKPGPWEREINWSHGWSHRWDQNVKEPCRAHLWPWNPLTPTTSPTKFDTNRTMGFDLEKLWALSYPQSLGLEIVKSQPFVFQSGWFLTPTRKFAYNINIYTEIFRWELLINKDCMEYPIFGPHAHLPPSPYLTLIHHYAQLDKNSEKKNDALKKTLN